MQIHRLALGEMGANCYIVETAPGQCIAVDIGGDSARFLDFIRARSLRLNKILLTHGHFDHIGGVEEVRLAVGAEVFIHADDARMLDSEIYSLHAGMSGRKFVPVTSYTAISDNSHITDGILTFRAIHTPGHSMGSVCYICEDVIFSGDTLFRLSVGRTDFPGSSPYDMESSLRALYMLDGDFRVLPGHGESTTLGMERKMNPYMKGSKNE